MSAPAENWVTAQGLLCERVTVVALGGNLGGLDEVRKRCRSAIDTLSEDWGPATVSSFLRTAPIGEVQEQPEFLNAVAAFRPTQDLRPLDALARLQALELEHGRTRQVAGGARTLDLDLLFVGQETHALGGLILPHPRMHLRAFVLQPLAELFGGELRLHAKGPSVATCLRSPGVVAQRVERDL
jgi:2-amino-4-hydroxy-6-hydroxymethyldihydropteridine diphosphokinase